MPPDPVVPAPSDSLLLEHAAAGDAEAFGVLYGRYQHIVYRFARAMIGSADAAEDITQEVFVTLLNDAGRYDPARAAFSTYLYGIVRNLSRARLRRDRRRSSIEAIGIACHDLALNDPLTTIEREEIVASMRRALARLPSRSRELIVLCDLHGLSYQEAAVVVNASVGAVRSRLHRARQLLKLRLTRTSRTVSRSVMTPMRYAI